MRDEEYEGYRSPEEEATVDSMASDDHVPRRESLEKYVDILLDACGMVEDLYFNVPLVTEIIDENEYKAALDYRERVYCYELYHHQRTLIARRGLHRIGLLLNAETDKNGTVYTNWIGARKPDYVLHRPGEGKHNVAIVEVKPIAANLGLIKADLPKLKDFLNPNRMNYFGAIALVYGEQAGKIEQIEQALKDNFGDYWPARFRALWHRAPETRPMIWNPATGKFPSEGR
jgi:hypothetical protein